MSTLEPEFGPDGQLIRTPERRQPMRSGQDAQQRSIHISSCDGLIVMGPSLAEEACVHVVARHSGLRRFELSSE